MSGVYQPGQYSQPSQSPMPMHAPGQPYQQSRMYQPPQRPSDGILPTTQPTHPNNSSQPAMMGSMSGPAGYPHSSTMQQHQPQTDGRHQRSTPTSHYYPNHHALSQQQDLQPQPSVYSQNQDLGSDAYGNYRLNPSPVATGPEGMQRILIYTTETHS